MTPEEIQKLRRKKNKVWIQIEDLQYDVDEINRKIADLMKQRETLFKAIEDKSNEAQLLAEQIDGAVYENMKKEQYEWREPNGSTTD